MAVELPPLPYADDALAPHISAHTMSFHYGKHHASYVANLNKLIDGTELANSTLEEIILAVDPNDPANPALLSPALFSPALFSPALFNNAAQIWNHTFYWNSMTPDGGGDPTGSLASAIDSAFGSIDNFRTQFKADAVGNFGSGWTWLVQAEEGLTILKTDDADTPLKHGQTALLTIDVWEHAYYLDYQNARPAYVDAFLQHLVNWEFAASNYTA